MTPEQLRKFLYTKSPAGSKRVALIKDEGLGQERVVASWDREEIERAADPALQERDIVAAVFEAAKDEVGEGTDPIRFKIAWQDARMLELKSAIHVESPQGERAAATGEYKGGPISANLIVGELLSALLSKDKQMNAATLTLTTAYDKALGHQQRAIETLSRAVDVLQERIRADGALPVNVVIDPEVKDAQLATQRMKQQAFGKLLEKGPEIVSDIVKVVAQVAAEKAMGVAPSGSVAKANGAKATTS